MDILFATSEAVPFIKSGGLADVTGTLPAALKGHVDNVYAILPYYTLIDPYFREKTESVCEFYVDVGWRRQYCGIRKTVHNGVTFFFVDNEYYFGRNYIYGDISLDECERFAFFNRAVLEALVHIKIVPDIIHCNDWQCGMIPFLLRTQYGGREQYSHIRTVYTIHNILYQGIFPWEWVEDVLSVPRTYFSSEALEFHGNVNFMKAGIVFSDAVSTVSPTYAREITSSDLGEGLEGVLHAKKPTVYGILNGIDHAQFSPYDDIHLDSHYACYELSGKARCKESLQYELWLDNEPEKPLLAIVSRLTEQKGLYLIEHSWERLMALDVQLAVIGTGDRHFEDFFRWLSAKNGGKVAARIEYNEHMSRRIYAGSDIFLMPSRTEPCGLAQMIALRYGTIPVVHETGGLADSIIPYNKYTWDGTGFSFFDYCEEQFINAVERAVACYRNREEWANLVNRAMQLDFSWDTSARRYLEMYKDVVTG